MIDPCRCPSAFSSAAFGCFLSESSGCVHEETAAAAVQILGTQCIGVPHEPSRGFFVVSRASGGSLVCTAGDTYHAVIEEASRALTFAVLSQHVAGSVYWINLSSTARLPGTHAFSISLSLVETVRRGQQRAERSVRSLHDHLALQSWLRDRSCSWDPVRLPAAATLVRLTSRPTARPASLPRCTHVPSAGELAFASFPRGGGGESCAGLCTGNATARILDTSNDRRLAARRKQGFHHVPVAAHCRLHWRLARVHNA